MLNVNEIYATIQGEARWTGTPAIFIRLQGCPVGCGWCDTKYTWECHEGDRTHGLLDDAMAVINADEPLWAQFDVMDVVRYCERFSLRHAVLTGGEPLMQDVEELIWHLWDRGVRVQIETSGTFMPKQLDSIRHMTWLTVSPKINMPGGRQVDHRMMHAANEIKHPVGKLRDVQQLDELLTDVGPCKAVVDGMVWLQPLSQSKQATKLCIEIAQQRNWKVSIQTHKYLGIR